MALLVLAPITLNAQCFSLWSKDSIGKVQSTTSNGMFGGTKIEDKNLVYFIIMFHTSAAHCKAVVSSDLYSLNL
jgi:hypothetical protein